MRITRCGDEPRLKMFNTLLKMMYPASCAGCASSETSHSDYLCWQCRAQIKTITHPYCSCCGNPVEGKIDHAYVCYSCSDKKPFFDQARSAARYEGLLRELIHQFKYNDALWLQDTLADLLLACYRFHYETCGIDAVSCVPLFPSRQRERGYNQAHLLAQAVAHSICKPFVNSRLSRMRPTMTQTNLTADQRANNVRGAFRISRPNTVEGRRILLIDDVMTTGATLNECARVLKEAGAASVYALTIVRGG